MKFKKLKVKTLYDSRTKPSRILRHSSDLFEIVKFDEDEDVRGKMKVLKRLQRITNYVDSELENEPTPGDLIFDDDDEHQKQAVYIMWMPTTRLIIGYLSVMQLEECNELKSFVDGVITTGRTIISEPVVGITRLWSYGMRQNTKCRRNKSSKDDQAVEFAERNNEAILLSLLEMCRKTFTDEAVIMKSHLAFSYLTDELLSFLSKYLDYSSTEIRICFPNRS